MLHNVSYYPLRLIMKESICLGCVFACYVDIPFESHKFKSGSFGKWE